MRNIIILPIRTFLTYCCNQLLEFISGFLLTSHPNWNPRIWSNNELAAIAKNFEGNVVNVSAAEDSDKNGEKYKDYFVNAKSYAITNLGSGEEGGGISREELMLDLSIPYDGRYGKFDIVFNHTVIEHLPSFETSINNLCSLSNDCVVTVVPFIQMFHGRLGSYTDFWRFTPKLLIDEFHKRGFYTLYIAWNEHHPLSHVYVFHVATRNPQKYRKIFHTVKLPIVNTNGPGVNFTNFLFGKKEQENYFSLRKLGEYIGSRMVVD